MFLPIVVHLILLHGLHGSEIYINTEEIVAIRSPAQQSLIKEGFRCFIATADGKFVNVIETCEEVSRLIEQIKKNGR
jgi:hypothetical protein